MALFLLLRVILWMATLDMLLAVTHHIVFGFFQNKKGRRGEERGSIVISLLKSTIPSSSLLKITL